MANLVLDRLAIHYVNKKTNAFLPADAEFDLAQTNPRIIDFFADLAREIWEEEDSGSTRSGNFSTAMGFTAPGLIATCVEVILLNDNRFFATSRQIGEHLFQVTPPSASPGLLAVMRVRHAASGNPHVALIKVRHKNDKIVKSEHAILTRLEVQDIENLLISEIQKGALLPHPEKTEYHLKIVDKQATDDPARYFSEGFLGSQSKPSDEAQVKGLMQTLTKYGQVRGLPVRPEKRPRLVRALQERQVNVTIPAITEIVQAQGFFGDQFDADDFEKFIEGSELGRVDIPASRFSYRGKEAKKARNFSFRFRDPKYRGLQISGPTEVMDQIISVQGEQVTFQITTTSDGYYDTYE